MEDLTDKKYDPVGRCIYCGREDDLENEHPMPYALGGTAVLPDSTCSDCARITGAVEQDVLRGPMRKIRIHRQIQSRSNHKSASETLPITLVDGGEEKHVEVPREDYPILFAFPLCLEPGELRQDNYESGIQMIGLLPYSFGPTPKEVVDQYEADSIKVDESYSPTDFARMIAKISYSFAAAEGVLDQVDNSPVVSSILGETDDIGRWVGTFDLDQWAEVIGRGDPITPERKDENTLTVDLQVEHKSLMEMAPVTQKETRLHEVRVFTSQFGRRNYLVGGVQLFADAGTPIYGVLLGELT